MKHPTLATYDRLDALSRERALTEAESIELEQAIERLIYGPRFPGIDMALLRRGMLRDRRRRSAAAPIRETA